MITKNDKMINKELIKNYFQFQSLFDMKEELFNPFRPRKIEKRDF